MPAFLALAGVLAGLYGFLVAVTLGPDDGLDWFAFAGGNAVADCVADNHGDDGKTLIGVDAADRDEHGDADQRDQRNQGFTWVL